MRKYSAPQRNEAISKEVNECCKNQRSPRCKRGESYVHVNIIIGELKRRSTHKIQDHDAAIVR